ncbi:MAG TPA: DUF4382 domain-containing protein [Candidatus Eisenbacteria bacterium]|nr:DUF4382 domain-containing protein [Candidatus Eisenbacteria bacterium]
MKNRVFAALAAASCLVWMGCSSDRNGSGRLNGAGTGHVTVHLTDAPGDYDAVNVAITGVSLRREGDDDGWEDLDMEGGMFDLLLLQNGVMTTLALGDVPPGHYDQVRLLLGPGSNVVVDGETHSLTVPSGMSSGLKLKGDFDIVEGENHELILDFDAAKSIHRTGNGKYMMRPVVTLTVGDVVNPPPADTTGSITGRTLPAGATATISAMQGTTTARSTTNDATGAFTLDPLLAGSYDVKIDADTTYRDTTITGVSVAAGQVTELGDIQLQTVVAPAGAARAVAGVRRR